MEIWCCSRAAVHAGREGHRLMLVGARRGGRVRPGSGVAEAGVVHALVAHRAYGLGHDRDAESGRDEGEQGDELVGLLHVLGRTCAAWAMRAVGPTRVAPFDGEGSEGRAREELASGLWARDGTGLHTGRLQRATRAAGPAGHRSRQARCAAPREPAGRPAGSRTVRSATFVSDGLAALSSLLDEPLIRAARAAGCWIVAADRTAGDHPLPARRTRRGDRGR